IWVIPRTETQFGRNGLFTMMSLILLIMNLISGRKPYIPVGDANSGIRKINFILKRLAFTWNGVPVATTHLKNRSRYQLLIIVPRRKRKSLGQFMPSRDQLE